MYKYMNDEKPCSNFGGPPYGSLSPDDDRQLLPSAEHKNTQCVRRDIQVVTQRVTPRVTTTRGHLSTIEP